MSIKARDVFTEKKKKLIKFETKGVSKIIDKGPSDKLIHKQGRNPKMATLKPRYTETSKS